MSTDFTRSWLRGLGVGTAVAMLGVVSSDPAVAAIATTTMSVSLVIQAGCAVSATALNFGTTSVLAAPVYQTSNVNVTCTDGTAYNVGLDNGANALSGQRRMIGPASETVTYNLYQDSGHTLAWGNTIGTNTVSGTGSGNTELYIVYGEVIGPQASPDPGGYSDIVNVTVTY